MFSAIRLVVFSFCFIACLRVCLDDAFDDGVDGVTVGRYGYVNWGMLV